MVGRMQGRTYNASIRCYAGEENEHAICADVDGRIGVAKWKGVCGFGEEFVGEKVVSYKRVLVRGFKD